MHKTKPKTTQNLRRKKNLMPIKPKTEKKKEKNKTMRFLQEAMER